MIGVWYLGSGTSVYLLYNLIMTDSQKLLPLVDVICFSLDLNFCNDKIRLFLELSYKKGIQKPKSK